MRLFERSNRGTVLTAEGEYLYSALEPLYLHMDRSIQMAKHYSESPARVLRIVQPSSYDYSENFAQIRSITRQYEKKYPEVSLLESLRDFNELRQTLEFGNVDLVFSQDFVINGVPGVSQKRVSKFKSYVAMSGNHPNAKSSKLDISALNNEIFYAVPSHSDDRSDIEAVLNFCNHMGFTPKGVEFLPNFQTLLHVVKLGRGMSITGKFVDIGVEGDIKYFPVDRGFAQRYIVVAWRTGKLTREATQFIEMLPDELLD